MNTITLAVEFEDIGNNLFGLGTGWATKALKLGLLLIVVVTVISKFSLKAGIGALIGLIFANGIYGARQDLSDSFTDFLISSQGSPARHAPQYPGASPDAPAPGAGGGGERA